MKETLTKCYCGHTIYCDCGPLEEDLLKDWDVTLNDGIPYISDDFQIGPDGAYEHTEEDEFYNWDVTLNDDEPLLEHLANEAFKSVGDEGLFPNHTDKDIWVNGFKAGYLADKKD